MSARPTSTITAYPNIPEKVTTETAINVELGHSVGLRQIVFLASPRKTQISIKSSLHKSTVSGAPPTQETAERNGGGVVWGIGLVAGAGLSSGLAQTHSFCRQMTKPCPGSSLLKAAPG